MTMFCTKEPPNAINFRHLSSCDAVALKLSLVRLDLQQIRVQLFPLKPLRQPDSAHWSLSVSADKKIHFNG